MAIRVTMDEFPEDLFRRINEQAQLHRTSPEHEIIACIEASLDMRRPPASAVLAQARELRSKVGGTLTEEALTLMKAQGRP